MPRPRQRQPKLPDRGPRAPLASPAQDPDAPRARTQPPRLAHLLSGLQAEPRTYAPRERARLIAQGKYPPWQPMYTFLQGRTLAHVARQSGLAQPTVSAILRGYREPYLFTGLRLARALGVTPDQLDRYLDRVQRNPLE